MLLGGNLRDFLPTKPFLLRANDLSSTWKEIADYRELALTKRATKNQEQWSEHVKEHAPTSVCKTSREINHLDGHDEV